MSDVDRYPSVEPDGQGPGFVDLIGTHPCFEEFGGDAACIPIYYLTLSDDGKVELIQVTPSVRVPIN
jgi:hypothetical protein